MKKELLDEFLHALRKSAVSGAVEVYFFPGEAANLTLDVGPVKGQELEQAIERAGQTCLALQSNRESLLEAIAGEFLEEYNEICHPDKPESKDEFLSKIYLDSVTLGAETSTVSMVYLPENLEDFFGDHAISIWLNSDLEIESVTMVG